MTKAEKVTNVPSVSSPPCSTSANIVASLPWYSSQASQTKGQGRSLSLPSLSLSSLLFSFFRPLSSSLMRGREGKGRGKNRPPSFLFCFLFAAVGTHRLEASEGGEGQANDEAGSGESEGLDCNATLYTWSADPPSFPSFGGVSPSCEKSFAGMHSEVGGGGRRRRRVSLRRKGRRGDPLIKLLRSFARCFGCLHPSLIVTKMAIAGGQSIMK